MIVEWIVLHVFKVKGPMAVHRRELSPSLEVGESVLSGPAMVLDVTFLMDFDGRCSAFRFRFRMVPINLLTLANRARTETTYSLVIAGKIVYCRHGNETFLPCSSTGEIRGPDAINVWPSTFVG